MLSFEISAAWRLMVAAAVASATTAAAFASHTASSPAATACLVRNRSPFTWILEISSATPTRRAASLTSAAAAFRMLSFFRW
eukprot:7391975-Prymnesium_polylepis.2